jgi:hypothetical protein
MAFFARFSKISFQQLARRLLFICYYVTYISLIFSQQLQIDKSLEEAVNLVMKET